MELYLMSAFSRYGYDFLDDETITILRLFSEKLGSIDTKKFRPNRNDVDIELFCNKYFKDDASFLNKSIIKDSYMLTISSINASSVDTIIDISWEGCVHTGNPDNSPVDYVAKLRFKIEDNNVITPISIRYMDCWDEKRLATLFD